MEQEFFAIKRLLDNKKVQYEIYEHEPVYTSKDAARVRGEDLRTGVKSLIFKADDDFILVLVPGDRKADFQKLRNITAKNNIRLATPQEVLDVCNCEIGSVHPFGLLMGPGLKTYMEKTILQNDRINFNVGLHTMTVRMRPQDMKDVIEPVVVDIIKA